VAQVREQIASVLDMAHDLRPGFKAFVEQLDAQVQLAGTPTSEHALHFALALGFQAAYELPIGTVIFERPAAGNKRTDIWIAQPLDVAVELKYQHPIPSGMNRPFPQLFGSLLADFNKVVDAEASQRAVVLVIDKAGYAYISGRSCHNLLPLDVGDQRTIDGLGLRQLSSTAATQAESHGAWRPLVVELLAKSEITSWTAMMWTVAAAG
jgi:hypothetical protein